MTGRDNPDPEFTITVLTDSEANTVSLRVARPQGLLMLHLSPPQARGLATSILKRLDQIEATRRASRGPTIPGES
jgi:hypothetical protein